MPRRIPQIITKKELGRIIECIINEQAACPQFSNYYKAKHILQILFMYFLGLRYNEVRTIEIKNIDFKKKQIYLPAKYVKTRQDDDMPVPDFLYSTMINFLKLRCKLFHKNPYLFPNKNGRIDDRNYLSKKFCDILKKLNISKLSYEDKSGFKRMSKNLYSLRHSFGTFVYDKTHDIKKTAIALRHHDSLLRCASRYVHISENKTRQDIFKEIF